MSIKNRDDLIETIIDTMVENADMKDLIQMFCDGQYDYLRTLSDNELIEQAELYDVEVLED